MSWFKRYPVLTLAFGVWFIIGTPLFILALRQEMNEKKITLPESKWTCTEYRDVKVIRTRMVGKVTYPYSDTNRECFSWKRHD